MKKQMNKMRDAPLTLQFSVAQQPKSDHLTAEVSASRIFRQTHA